MKLSYTQKAFLMLVLLAVSYFQFSCSKEESKSNEVSSGSPVKVVNPSLTNLNNFLVLNGNTVFQKKEIIRATFPGYVAKLIKKIGDKVSAGDDILQLQTKELSGADSTTIKLGSKSFSGLVNIRAKSGGVLTELNHNTGDFVTEGEQIAVIYDPSSMIIELNVHYSEASELKPGNECSVELPDGKSLKAFIYKSLPVINPASQTQTFLIRLKEFTALPESLNVNVKIPSKTVRNALTVPKSALMTDETQSKFWLMKLVNDTTAVKIFVQKGIENKNEVQVTGGGINQNDKIISEGAFGLPDTAHVVIEK